MRYTWLLDQFRKKGGTLSAADPECVIPSGGDAKSCTVARGNGVSSADAFSVDDSEAPSNAVAANSVSYLGEKYYASKGLWPGATTQQPECDRRAAFLGIPYGGVTTISVVGNSCPRNDSWNVYSNFRITPVFTPNRSATPTNTTLPPLTVSNSQEILQDTSGDVVQYVVLEWWGTLPATASGKLSMEVFIAP